MSNSNITRMSIEDIRQLKGETDWDRLAREQAAGIEPEADDDEFEIDWSKAQWVEPVAKTPVSMRLDPDILSFFKAQGKGYQTRINAVLRAYMEAKQSGQA